MRPLRRLALLRNIATDRLRRLPVVTLMAHSRCNCRCVMCDIWKNNNNPSEISPEQARTWLPALLDLGVENLVFSGGEALMHSDLWGLIDAFAPLKARITLLTTGLLLKREAEAAVTCCDEIIVSLDGSEGVHNHIRNLPRAFARLAEGVAAVRDLAPRYPISARSVVQRGNIDDVRNTIETARSLGLNSISFLPADLSSTAFNHTADWIASDALNLAPDDAQLARFDTLVDQLQREQADLFESRFVLESPAKLRRIPQYYRAVTGRAALPAVSCNAPWVSVVIETDGQVRPCFFHDAYPQQGDLGETLNSDAALDFRRALDVTADPTCARCVCTLTL